MTPTFYLARSLTFHYYIFVSDEEKRIFFSRYYLSEKACRKGIAELKECASQHTLVAKTEQPSGNYSFIIRNKKGDVLGHSPTYFAASPRDLAIRLLVSQCNIAMISLNKSEGELMHAVSEAVLG